jgi:hypothetical protein
MTVGKIFWRVVKHYKFNRKEQAHLLGILPVNYKLLAKLESKKEVPLKDEILVRINHLVAIHRALLTMFPHNKEVVSNWFKVPRPCFDNKSAIEFIKGDELASYAKLFAVRAVVEQMVSK